jgi:DNA-directed RNA polymerase subunit M/transcription elongation factor TFIIS
MENQNNMQENKENIVQAPSLYHLKCPNCGAEEFVILGKKGGFGAALGLSVVLGPAGNLLADQMSKKDYKLESIRFKCKSCKKKFESYPLTAEPDEILSEPCKVIFNRLSNIVGGAVSQSVWLNGVKVGTVGSGKTLEFDTITKHNTLFVTDQSGTAFKSNYQFVAQPGGSKKVNFDRQFI